MTNHLPECPKSDVRMVALYGDQCLCPALRACEQRVRAEQQADLDHVAYVLGQTSERQRSVTLIADAYGKGLSSARDAVADCRVPWPTATGDLVNEGIDAALAAIDALRGESRG